MLLDQLKAIFLGEKHESVHGSLGLLGVLGCLLGRWHGRRHHGARGCGGSHRGKEVGNPVPEIEASKPRVWAAAAGRKLIRQILAGIRSKYRQAWSLNLYSLISPREFKFFEPVAEVGSPDGLGMVGGKAHVRSGDVLARDTVLLQGEPRVGGAPTWGGKIDEKPRAYDKIN